MVALLFLFGSPGFGVEPDRLRDSEGWTTGVSQLPGTDTIYMKNGSILHGMVVRFENGMFTIVIPGTRSRATIHISDVDRIEFAELASTSNPPQRETSLPANERAATESSSTQSQGPDRVEPATGAPVESQPAPPPEVERVAASPSSSPERGRIERGAGAIVPSPDEPTSSGETTGAVEPKAQLIEPPESSEPRAASSTARRRAPGDIELPEISETVVEVSGRDVWADSGFDVLKDDRLRFSATGRVNLSRTQSTGPEGVNIADPRKMMSGRPTGGLIAVIGDDNDDFIFIGTAAEFVAERSGRLFLMVNEDNLDDNSGAFSIRIQLDRPPRPEPR